MNPEHRAPKRFMIRFGKSYVKQDGRECVIRTDNVNLAMQFATERAARAFVVANDGRALPGAACIVEPVPPSKPAIFASRELDRRPAHRITSLLQIALGPDVYASGPEGKRRVVRQLAGAATETIAEAATWSEALTSAMAREGLDERDLDRIWDAHYAHIGR